VAFCIAATSGAGDLLAGPAVTAAPARDPGILDSTGLTDHLAKASTFRSHGDVVQLDTEVLATSVRGDTGWLAAQVSHRGTPAPKVRFTLLAERDETEWRIRHLHFSSLPAD
jgi:hypothetical protein